MGEELRVSEIPFIKSRLRSELDNLEHQVRLEKIDRLRRAIAENTYQVSAAELARKIINYMLQS